MLPIIKKAKNALKPKGAFERALERFREQKARAECEVPANPMPETLTVRGRCTVTGEYYRTIYRRASEDGKFVPHRQVNERWLDENGLDNSGNAALTENQTYPASAFRHFARQPCPCCEKKLVYSEIYCNRCQLWVCTGRSYVDKDGVFIHVCHEDCGSRGAVGKSVESIEGETQAATRAPSSKPQRGVVTQQKQKMVSTGQRPLLKGGDK